MDSSHPYLHSWILSISAFSIDSESPHFSSSSTCTSLVQSTIVCHLGYCNSLLTGLLLLHCLYYRHTRLGLYYVRYGTSLLRTLQWLSVTHILCPTKDYNIPFTRNSSPVTILLLHKFPDKVAFLLLLEHHKQRSKRGCHSPGAERSASLQPRSRTGLFAYRVHRAVVQWRRSIMMGTLHPGAWPPNAGIIGHERVPPWIPMCRSNLSRVMSILFQRPSQQMSYTFTSMCRHVNFACPCTQVIAWLHVCEEMCFLSRPFASLWEPILFQWLCVWRTEIIVVLDDRFYAHTWDPTCADVEAQVHT